MNELLMAVNPDPDSKLGYLLKLPVDGGMVFRTSATWPRMKALYCQLVDAADWPSTPDVVERARIRSCVRRGAAIDLILDRSRENRSQLVFTKARGRYVVSWQAPRTRKQARPNVSTPTARGAGIADLEIARRHPGALRVPLRHPAGHHGQACPGVWRLWDHPRQQGDRRGGT